MNLKDELWKVENRDLPYVISRSRDVLEAYNLHPVWKSGYMRYAEQCVDLAMRAICEVESDEHQG